MVTSQEFLSSLLGHLQTSMAPMAVADAPGAVARGMISGQSLPEAFSSVSADPFSMEDRVYGEDITGGAGSGMILELLTDPGLLLGLGAAGVGGLGAALLGRYSRGAGADLSEEAIKQLSRGTPAEQLLAGQIAADKTVGHTLLQSEFPPAGTPWGAGMVDFPKHGALSSSVGLDEPESLGAMSYRLVTELEKAANEDPGRVLFREDLYNPVDLSDTLSETQIKRLRGVRSRMINEGMFPPPGGGEGGGEFISSPLTKELLLSKGGGAESPLGDAYGEAKSLLLPFLKEKSEQIGDRGVTLARLLEEYSDPLPRHGYQYFRGLVEPDYFEMFSGSPSYIADIWPPLRSVDEAYARAYGEYKKSLPSGEEVGHVAHFDTDEFYASTGKKPRKRGIPDIDAEEKFFGAQLEDDLFGPHSEARREFNREMAQRIKSPEDLANKILSASKARNVSMRRANPMTGTRHPARMLRLLEGSGVYEEVGKRIGVVPMSGYDAPFYSPRMANELFSDQVQKDLAEGGVDIEELINKITRHETGSGVEAAEDIARALGVTPDHQIGDVLGITENDLTIEGWVNKLAFHTHKGASEARYNLLPGKMTYEGNPKISGVPREKKLSAGIHRSSAISGDIPLSGRVAPEDVFEGAALGEPTSPFYSTTPMGEFPPGAREVITHREVGPTEGIVDVHQLHPTMPRVSGGRHSAVTHWRGSEMPVTGAKDPSLHFMETQSAETIKGLTTKPSRTPGTPGLVEDLYGKIGTSLRSDVVSEEPSAWARRFLAPPEDPEDAVLQAVAKVAYDLAEEGDYDSVWRHMSHLVSEEVSEEQGEVIKDDFYTAGYNLMKDHQEGLDEGEIELDDLVDLLRNDMEESRAFTAETEVPKGSFWSENRSGIVTPLLRGKDATDVENQRNLLMALLQIAQEPNVSGLSHSGAREVHSAVGFDPKFGKQIYGEVPTAGRGEFGRATQEITDLRDALLGGPVRDESPSYHRYTQQAAEEAGIDLDPLTEDGETLSSILEDYWSVPEYKAEAVEKLNERLSLLESKSSTRPHKGLIEKYMEKVTGVKPELVQPARSAGSRRYRRQRAHGDPLQYYRLREESGEWVSPKVASLMDHLLKKGIPIVPGLIPFLLANSGDYDGSR